MSLLLEVIVEVVLTVAASVLIAIEHWLLARGERDDEERYDYRYDKADRR